MRRDVSACSPATAHSKSTQPVAVRFSDRHRCVAEAVGIDYVSGITDAARCSFCAVFTENKAAGPEFAMGSPVATTGNPVATTSADVCR
jgi:hypothetical protein